MEKRKGVITPEIGEFIRKNTDMTVKELSEATNIEKSKIYYYVRKYDIKVKKRESTVQKFLNQLKG